LKVIKNKTSGLKLKSAPQAIASGRTKKVKKKMQYMHRKTYRTQNKMSKSYHMQYVKTN